jgi:tetratricopeptide (TPR) repeat protein
MLNWIRLRFASQGLAALQDAEQARRDGDLGTARRECLAALRQAPQSARALALMAAICADQQQFKAGLDWARRAIAADPQLASARYALGRLHEGLSQHEQAEAAYRAVIDIEPDHARAHNNLGCMLHFQGKGPEALACYRRALALDPDQPEALRNMAILAGGTDDFVEALEAFQRRVAQSPTDAHAYFSLGNIYTELGLHHEALQNFERAILLQPQQAEFHFSMAFLLLLLGDYARGWQEYEWRWRMDALNAPLRRFSQPLWNGEAFEGKTLLVHGETGLGDMLQFVRYARLAAQRCARVIVECQPALHGLLLDVDGISQVAVQGTPLPPFDAHLPLIRFPVIYGTTLGNVPWNGPYIRADTGLAAAWQARMPPEHASALKIGLVWSGNPQNPNDRRRSLPLAMLAPLTGIPGTVYYSLQKGPGAAQVADAPAGMHLTDLTQDIGDFADTAALLSQLDLVISIDTSVAHLAGAMGKPVWVLLPFATDWRYHAARDDNPWYPSMRLFRQQRDGDWKALVSQVADAVAAHAASRASW